MANSVSDLSIVRQINTQHADLVHDVSYSYNGRRMATCSSDQTVKIWDLGEDNEWHMTASWQAHPSNIWRVVWAHPEFGHVIATCSFDKSIAIWEEIGLARRDSGEQINTWQKKLSLAECKASVTDVKFAPHYLGLILGFCSADCWVYICELPDISEMNLYRSYKYDTKVSCSCLSWNPSRITPPLVAVGSDTVSGGISKVFIYKFIQEEPKGLKELVSPISVPGPVRDVAFAPHMGRSFFQLAIAARNVHIFRLYPTDDNFNKNQSDSFNVEEVATLEKHKSQIWRVEWNITGTVLASSGDDGQVRLWKANYSGKWDSCATIRDSEVVNNNIKTL
ncbi:Nucleoporin seh1 [Trichoplax sp. H2]|nr:Nucleoporin seh1 [Trichoplax sp. H2]|eukprot:RDD46881.1 Nucleoporin seh1 [Trichoplax sp. H2]